MPDLKSELSKVITAWSDDVPTSPNIIGGHRITSNSTRTTFNYVRDNPGVTSTEASVALEKLGVKSGSSTSLLSTMVARGNLRKTASGALFTAQKEYAPIKGAKVQRPKKKAVAPVVDDPKPVEAVQINAAWDAETLLNNLSIKQARALYDELRTIFGG
jgi:hypothetical protein